ncbi:MAG: hypothetical protein IIA67_01420 [Planctomycetes bacterium]|nr:hypothetical protein [Planctomycetota bacterium]
MIIVLTPESVVPEPGLLPFAEKMKESPEVTEELRNKIFALGGFADLVPGGEEAAEDKDKDNEESTEGAEPIETSG